MSPQAIGAAMFFGIIALAFCLWTIDELKRQRNRSWRNKIYKMPPDHRWWKDPPNEPPEEDH